MEGYYDAYKALNKEQKQAVDTIDGPVMVVAGPGTGKTQVLAIRIAHILEVTDTPAHGILCLTFTRSGVKAMRERLTQYVGARGREVTITTFHSFAIGLVEQHYDFLDFPQVPTLLDEAQAVVLIDELLHERGWDHIRPRGDAARYFNDLRSLVSLMKRERITPEQFRVEVEKEIITLTESPDSVSSRGETKGQLKKEVQKKIEGLERTKEVIEFYKSYEELKRTRGFIDYDDVLSYAVELVEKSEDVRADLRENYLYVLVDEHQDSSGVQNAFLRAVWQDTERPNIFVVGDDRQLIYGFGGASLSYFEEFKTLFGKATFISLVENYRSTAPILSLADELLQSTLSNEKLRSNREGGENVKLFEYSYSRDEILAAGLHFKQAIAGGALPEECALLVPKNRHVKHAVQVLRDLGLPVQSQGSVSLFSLREMRSLLMVLRIIADPYDVIALSQSLFDPLSGIPPLAAHAFMRNTKTLSLQALLESNTGLFEDPIVVWAKKLAQWVEEATRVGVGPLIHHVGNELLVDTARDHESLVHRIELVRTMLHLADNRTEQHPHETLTEFLHYLDRLEAYGHTIPVATLLGGQGISVLTLHGSKGLEFDYVWIAHMNESVLMAQKRLGFTIPSSIETLIEARDRAVATREVYVALTRAKKRCTISYARTTVDGATLEIAQVLADLPEAYFDKRDAEDTEQELVALDPKVYVTKEPPIEQHATLIELVAHQYSDSKVSVTLLNNFFECPWKWYFRNLLKLPELKSEHQVFGSAVHDCIEHILNGGLKYTEKDIRSRIGWYLEKEGMSRSVTRLVKEGTHVVMSWVDTYLPQIAANHSAERSLSYKDPQWPHLTMYGKIDLTERFPDDTIAVTDFKTGSSKTSTAIEKIDDEGRLSSHLRQLAMYSYLIRGAEKKDVALSKLLYVEENPTEKHTIYQTHISDEQIDLLKRDIRDYDELVKNGEWMTRPCNTKTYGAGDTCEYCKWAREVYGV